MKEIKDCIIKAITNCDDNSKLLAIYIFITNILSK